MKKIFIGSLVAGLILFIWQFLSFALLNFHKPAQQYTDKQDVIMNFMKGQNLKDGGYFIPNIPDNASDDQREAYMKEAAGKPWVRVEYHNSMNMDMGMNMVRGFTVDVFIMLLFCWIIGRMKQPSVGTIVGAALATGLIVFLNIPYTNNIWYESFDIWAHLADAVVSWGIAGLWLSWWMRRGNSARKISKKPDQSLVMAE
jgi:hypothetical protein